VDKKKRPSFLKKKNKKYSEQSERTESKYTHIAKREMKSVLFEEINTSLLGVVVRDDDDRRERERENEREKKNLNLCVWGDLFVPWPKRLEKKISESFFSSSSLSKSPPHTRAFALTREMRSNNDSNDSILFFTTR